MPLFIGITILLMVLALRHGGFGLRMTSPVEADAALLSGVAMDQADFNGGIYFYLPFDGGHRISLLAVCQRVNDETIDSCG